MVGFSLLGFSQGTQGTPCPNKYGSDTVKAKEQLSLFNQYYQSKDYVKSYKYWKYLFDNAPCIQKRVTFNGPTIVKKVLADLKKTDDSLYNMRKEGLIDTILMIYPKRIEYYGNEGYVKGKWASDWAKLKPKERQEALKMFEESVALQGNKTSYTVPMNYLKAAIKENKKKQYGLDSLYALYFQMMDITTYNLKQGGKYQAKWETAETYMNKVMKPYLNCEKIEEYFKPQIEANPDDADMLKKVADLLINAKCEKTQFFLGIAEKIYELDPSPESAFTIAVGRHANKEHQQAVKWYVLSLDGADSDSAKAKIHMTVANLHEKHLNNIGEAHKAAKSALELNENLGGAYLIKAKYFASSASACDDKIDGRSVYWAAADMAAKAKAVDPSVEEKANKFINFCASNFIKQDQAFFKSFTLAEGASYTVPCLGVVTTVRYKK